MGFFGLSGLFLDFQDFHQQFFVPDKTALMLFLSKFCTLIRCVLCGFVFSADDAAVQ